MSKNEFKPVGDKISLKGGWELNHYQGEEGFLGWVALQVKRSCSEVKDLADLRENELKALGPNIKDIDDKLRSYWKKNKAFRHDPIERVYVVYFFESGLEPNNKHNLHIHLIPRPVSLQLMHGWKIYDATKQPEFPKRYKIFRCENKEITHASGKEMGNIIDYLNKHLKRKGK
ncbi:hypothetical protein ACFLZ2_05310 [Candidatus Margulisiibacteriota bacterium]